MRTVQIKGDGSSLWGESNGTYKVEKIKLRSIGPSYSDKNKAFAEVQLFGSNTEWVHYTDNAIEKGVANSKTILNEVKKQALTDGYVIDKIKLSWSEQGMQPDGGWSFDMYAKIIKRSE